MYSKNMIPSPHRKEDGVAIIIVLSFVVLLTGLVVAFLSRSLSEQQVSTSSVAQVKADLLAQSALDIVVGDLREEIVLGSSSSAVAVGSGTVYIPTSGTTMLPQRDANLTSGTLHNLIRVSKTTAPPSPAVATRASAVSSTTPSINHRSVSPARWNSHYLIPLQNGVTSPDFTPPQWVYMTGTGPAVVTSGTDATGRKVIGRYAFAVYDEGGLLDINGVGYPSDNASTYAPRKVNAAYADLTQLASGALSSQQINNLVGWRNYISATASGNFGSDYTVNGQAYFQHIATATNGFMTAAVGTGGNDQSFTSRQALIRYWKNPTINLPLESLQYFGTHSRDWNYASYTPHASRPKTSGVSKNDASGQDDTINPSFAKFLVTTPFTRLDGTTAEVGEPLVKRFALSRIGALQTGTNRAFGLVRASDGTYSYQDAEGGSNAIKTLGDVAQRNREPNFFELLKAAITAGAVTRAGATSGDPFVSISDDDKKIDYAIIQIGANIIDQYDENQYPSAITFGGRTFRGVEDLPYLYRVRQTIVKTSQPDPPAPSDGAAVSGTNLTVTGAAVAVIQPEIWNPHLTVASSTGARPTAFAFSIKTRGGTSVNDVIADSKDGVSSAAAAGADLPGFVDPGAAFTPLFGTQILFSDNSGALFREPVLLNQYNQPVGSSATSITTGSAGGAFSLPTTSGTYVGIYVGAAPLRWIQSGDDPEVLSANKVSVLGIDEGLIYQLSYQDGANWVVYDEKVGPAIGAVGAQDIAFDPADTKGLTTDIQTWSFAADPRTGRFGMIGGYQPTQVAPVAGNATGNTTGTSAKGVPSGNGWTVGATFEGDLMAVNQNGSTTRYEDADGKVRRAMGSAQSPLAAGSTNRPVILNRPFRSLGDLAHVFSGIPWKNLDLSFPESGYAALLDVFSINEVKSEKGLVAGKVNLNTRQSEVLKAILAGAELDGVVAVPGGTVASTTGASLASAVRARTSGTMQFKNLREIVGDYNGTDYDGLAPIIANELGTNLIRNWSAVAGTLANAGQARVWNLFIDIIAQPGRFGNNGDIDKFMVEGEQRYWVHIAIDRYTGRVLDRTIEVVKE